MKISIIATLSLAAVLGLSACSKQYDVKVEDNQTNSNGSGNGSGGGSGFSWKGTAPMSAKIDGKGWVASEIVVSNAGGFYWGVVGKTSDVIITVSVPFGAKPGDIFAMPTPAGVSMVVPTHPLVSFSGKVKVTVNNATNLEGYFYSDVKGAPGSPSDTLIHLTEGYFKVNK